MSFSELYTVLNSDIFSINIFIPSGLEISEKMSEESYINFDKNNLKKAIYVKKIQDDFFKKIQDSFYQDYIETYKNFLEDETIKNFILDNDITGLNMNQIILRAGGTTLYTKLSCNNKWNLLKGNYKHEFILNCNMPIQEEISIKKDQANEA